MQTISIVVASPNDVAEERKKIFEIARLLGQEFAGQVELEVRRWEDVRPGFERGGPAERINPRLRIADSDLLIGIFGKRLGTETGSRAEFAQAVEGWRTTGRPEIMVYFKSKPDAEIVSADDHRHWADLLDFKRSFPVEGFWSEFADSSDFAEKAGDHLRRFVDEEITKRRRRESFDRFDVQPHQINDLRVPGTQDLYSSFEPPDHFRRLEISTTLGYIDDEERANRIYILKDPIRPYDVQIGQTRSERNVGNPEAIPELSNLTLARVEQMYPFISGEEYKWIRMVLAELISDPAILDYIHDRDLDDEVRKIAAKNPSASPRTKKAECIFCKAGFRERRTLKGYQTRTIVIRNDFPYGPYFHFVAMPEEPVHSWEDVEYRQLKDLNCQIWRLLREEWDRDQLRGAAGVFIGFNSSIRHLVLGKHTRTAAGASVSHVHKQVWGMAPASVNLGDRLSALCHVWWQGDPEGGRPSGTDYLGAYLDALRGIDFVVWEDERVALYIPFGQISLHELQIMLKRETHTYLDLTPDEVVSLSQAEYLASRYFRRMGIHSFNEILLSEPFHRRTPRFRLIMTFVTREVDLAVSELNHLFVVDKHPTETLLQISRCKKEVMKEFEESTV